MSYTAGYSDEDTQQRPWQLIRLLSSILAAVPVDKRLTVAKTTNPDETMWENDEDFKEYQTSVDDTLWETIKDIIDRVAELAPFAKKIFDVGKKILPKITKFLPWV